MSSPDAYHHVLNMIYSKSDHAYVGATLVFAGFLPYGLFTSETLQAVYFACLIPPAAWHLFMWLRKTFFTKKE